MKHVKGLWPMLQEYEHHEIEEPIRCDACEGTGTFGDDPSACDCERCGGYGAICTLGFDMVNVGHA